MKWARALAGKPGTAVWRYVSSASPKACAEG